MTDPKMVVCYSDPCVVGVLERWWQRQLEWCEKETSRLLCCLDGAKNYSGNFGSSCWAGASRSSREVAKNRSFSWVFKQVPGRVVGLMYQISSRCVSKIPVNRSRTQTDVIDCGAVAHPCSSDILFTMGGLLDTCLAPLNLAGYLLSGRLGGWPISLQLPRIPNKPINSPKVQKLLIYEKNTASQFIPSPFRQIKFAFIPISDWLAG